MHKPNILHDSVAPWMFWLLFVQRETCVLPHVWHTGLHYFVLSALIGRCFVSEKNGSVCLCEKVGQTSEARWFWLCCFKVKHFMSLSCPELMASHGHGAITVNCWKQRPVTVNRPMSQQRSLLIGPFEFVRLCWGVHCMCVCVSVCAHLNSCMHMCGICHNKSSYLAVFNVLALSLCLCVFVLSPSSLLCHALSPCL